MTLNALRTNSTAKTDTNNESEEPSIPEYVDQSPVIFSTLPLELRERIYHYLLPPTLTSLNPLPPFLGLNLTADLTYSILHINKATRIDAGIYYLRSRCFEIHGPNQQAYFTRYLASFPDLHGYRAVHRLSFARFSELQTRGVVSSGYIELIEKCTGILELKLAFKQRDLLHKSYLKLWRMSERAERINPNDLALASVDMIVERYQLNRLSMLERLRRVELVVQQARIVTGEMMQHARDVAPDRLMRLVSEWLRLEFWRYGRRLDVLVDGGVVHSTYLDSYI